MYKAGMYKIIGTLLESADNGLKSNYQKLQLLFLGKLTKINQKIIDRLTVEYLLNQLTNQNDNNKNNNFLWLSFQKNQADVL